MKADRILKQYSHRFPDYVPRDQAAHCIRRARSLFLLARSACDDPLDRRSYAELHRDACRLLEDARAEAYVGRGEEDRELMAEIRIRTAEGLCNQSTCLLSALTDAVAKAPGDPGVKVHVADVQDHLDRTRVHLEQARSALSDGHFNFKQWYLWEQLRRRCDDLQLDLIEVLLQHTRSLLSSLQRVRSANDSIALDHTSVLLAQAHTAMSISPPCARVWDKWKRCHNHWTELDNTWKSLSEGFRPPEKYREVHAS
jgi:hypothetical protein